MKFIDAIFCDDIRYEQNNKLSLMGLYNDQMILHFDEPSEIKWPLPMKLSLLLRFKIEQHEKHPDRFEFEYALNKKSIVPINGEFGEKNNQTQFTLIIATIVPLELGDLGFSIKLYEGKKLLLSEKQEKAIKVTKE